MIEAFRKTDEELLSEKVKSGCTAAVAVVVKSPTSTQKIMFTANCGDARIVLKYTILFQFRDITSFADSLFNNYSRKGKAIRLSKDHKADSLEEQKRVESEGGVMLQGKVAGKSNIEY